MTSPLDKYQRMTALLSEYQRMVSALNRKGDQIREIEKERECLIIDIATIEKSILKLQKDLDEEIKKFNEANP